MSQTSVLVKAELDPQIHDRVVTLSIASGMGREKIYGYAIAYAICDLEFHNIIVAFAQGSFFTEHIQRAIEIKEKE